jgi:hypothetical protein
VPARPGCALRSGGACSAAHAGGTGRTGRSRNGGRSAGWAARTADSGCARLPCWASDRRCFSRGSCRPPSACGTGCARGPRNARCGTRLAGWPPGSGLTARTRWSTASSRASHAYPGRALRAGGAGRPTPRGSLTPRLTLGTSRPSQPTWSGRSRNRRCGTRGTRMTSPTSWTGRPCGRGCGPRDTGGSADTRWASRTRGAGHARRNTRWSCQATKPRRTCGARNTGRRAGGTRCALPSGRAAWTGNRRGSAGRACGTPAACGTGRAGDPERGQGCGADDEPDDRAGAVRCCDLDAAVRLGCPGDGVRGARHERGDLGDLIGGTHRRVRHVACEERLDVEVPRVTDRAQPGERFERGGQLDRRLRVVHRRREIRADCVGELASHARPLEGGPGEEGVPGAGDWATS